MTVVTSNSMPHYFIAVKYRGPYSDVFGTRGQKQLGVSISSNRSTRIDGMDFQLTPSRQGTIKTIRIAWKILFEIELPYFSERGNFFSWSTFYLWASH